MERPKDRPPARIVKAVALRYRTDDRAVREVTAKGSGHVAEQILKLAREHGIPIKEDPDLVEVLSRLDIEEELPPEVYVVVAEVLSFIYRANQAYGGRAEGEGGGVPDGRARA